MVGIDNGRGCAWRFCLAIKSEDHRRSHFYVGLLLKILYMGALSSVNKTPVLGQCQVMEEDIQEWEMKRSRANG